MIENRPTLNALTHVTLVIGIVIVIFPIYIAFVASTHEARDILMTVQGWFGTNFIENYSTVLEKGKASTGSISVALMMWNSLVMALGIVVGKISISILSAYAIVYFRFPFRMFFFWMIFVTLMLPVEVRILPTYEVVANLGLLNTYPGLVLPLIASATATFLFRQFFLTIPEGSTARSVFSLTFCSRFLAPTLPPCLSSSLFMAGTSIFGLCSSLQNRT